jgi:hypothetical protein
MSNLGNKSRMYQVSFHVTPAHYVPILWKDQPLSFQWAKATVIPLEKSSDTDQSQDAGLDDAIKTTYTIPAATITEAISHSLRMTRFVLNIASFYYSIGLNIKSPPSIVDLETEEGVAYDFRRLTFSKNKFCTKTIDSYFPFPIKGGKCSIDFELDRILSYERNELFGIGSFSRTITTFLDLYKSYIRNPALRKKVDFSLNILNESLQIPGFMSRFVLYWIAFEQLTNPPVRSGIVNDHSLQAISSILRNQVQPELSESDIERVKKKIREVHVKSKTALIVEEVKKYFRESENEIRRVYKRLEKTRGKIIHSAFREEEIPDLWFDTELLKSIVRQIVGVHLGYPKKQFKVPALENFRLRSAPKPEIRISLRPKDS